jgi:hypothetical protein
VVACGRCCGGTDLEDEDSKRGAEPVNATVGAAGAIAGGRARDSHGHDAVEQDGLHDADGVFRALVSALLACVKPCRARAVRARGSAERAEGPTGGTAGRWRGTS